MESSLPGGLGEPLCSAEVCPGAGAAAGLGTEPSPELPALRGGLQFPLSPLCVSPAAHAAVSAAAAGRARPEEGPLPSFVTRAAVSV